MAIYFILIVCVYILLCIVWLFGVIKNAMYYVCVGEYAPIVAYDKNSIKIVFHVGKDRPRPDVIVVAVSIMSTNNSSVKAFTFQAAVPKVNIL